MLASTFLQNKKQAAKKRSKDLRIEAVGVAIENDVNTSAARRRDDRVLKPQIESNNAAHDDNAILCKEMGVLFWIVVVIIVFMRPRTRSFCCGVCCCVRTKGRRWCGPLESMGFFEN